jgi:hypothetical protein
MVHYHTFFNAFYENSVLAAVVVVETVIAIIVVTLTKFQNIIRVEKGY